MPRIKCKRCNQIYLTGSESDIGYCNECKIIISKIADGVICPNCLAEPFELKHDECGSDFCTICGTFTNENKIKCCICSKLITNITDLCLLEKEVKVTEFKESTDRTYPFQDIEKPYCRNCYEEVTKEPPPETTDQKLDRLIICIESIAESLKTIVKRQKY
jgi:hypothetical protein